MKNNSNGPLHDERLSNDPEENLRLENEILRLRLKAELGGVYENDPNLPPGIENLFLKNVLAIEHGFARAKTVKLYELIGKPEYTNADEMDEAAIVIALQQLEEAMRKRGVIVEFRRSRDARSKYRFITEELFEQETDDMQMPGMTRHFQYEEFHPDHEMEIAERTKEFLSDWFKRAIDADCWYLGDSFIQPDGIILSKQELVSKLGAVFEAYTAFENGQYHIGEISFELHKGGSPEGLGFAEGVIRYDAILENGERKKIAGPLKVYFSREQGWWHIVFFHLAGFNT